MRDFTSPAAARRRAPAQSFGICPQQQRNDDEHLDGVEDSVRHDAGQDVAVLREGDRQHRRDHQDSDQHQRLAVDAVRGREHQRRGHGAHARLEKRAEEELLDDHGRDDDRDADPDRARDQPDDHGRDGWAGRLLADRGERPDTRAARSRSPSGSSGSTRPRRSGRPPRGRRPGRSLLQLQELGQRAPARERVVARQEEDAGSRARRRPRPARAAGLRAWSRRCPAAKGIATVRTRTAAEQSHGDGAASRLGESVLHEDGARARLHEGQEHAQASRHDQEHEGHGVHLFASGNGAD